MAKRNADGLGLDDQRTAPDAIRDTTLDVLLKADAFTGDAFFEALTQAVAASLRVDGVLVCELGLDELRPVASCGLDDVSLPSFALDAACGVVLLEGELAIEQDARRRFPRDEALQLLAAEAFAGVVLCAASTDPIGVLFVLHRQPLANAEVDAAVLKLLAPRVGAELERRQQDIALRRSEALLRRVVEQQGEVLFYQQLWPDTELVYVGPAVETLFGRPAAALLADSTLILQYLDAPDRRRLESALRSGAPGPLYLHLQRPDGTSRWIEYNGSAVEDAVNRIVGVSGSLRDVTERVETEAALQQREAYLRDLLLATQNTLLLLTPDGTIVDYVPGEVELINGGATPDAIVGRQLRAVLGNAVTGVLERLIRTTARSGRAQRVEIEVPGDPPRFYEAQFLSFGARQILIVLKHTPNQRAQETKRHPDDVVFVAPYRSRLNPYALTDRELAVLTLLVQGIPDKRIAGTLGVSTYTVNKHVGNILGKMNAASRTEAGVRAVREGLLERDAA
jgi:PAS domain S-box-containing protein